MCQSNDPDTAQDDLSELDNLKPNFDQSIGGTSSEPDEKTDRLIHKILAEREGLTNQFFSSVINEHKQNRKQRIYYGYAIFGFVGVYLVAAAVIMVFQNKLSIHDNVMITFLGTTVVNTIGLLMGVIRYLFRNSNSTIPIVWSIQECPKNMFMKAFKG